MRRFGPMAAPPWRVLAHPLRHRLLLEYQGEPASPSDVARRTGERLNLVSYHTGVLVRHGFLALERTELRRGGTARLYRSTSSGAIQDGEWPSIPVPLRRALVRDLLLIVAGDARRAALEGGFDHGHAHISRWPVQLDGEGVTEVARLLRGVVDDLARIQAESGRREGPRQRLEVALMAFAATQDTPP